MRSQMVQMCYQSPQAFGYHGYLAVARQPYHFMDGTPDASPQSFGARPSQENLRDILFSREIHNGTGYVFAFQDMRVDMQIARERQVLFEGSAAGFRHTAP